MVGTLSISWLVYGTGIHGSPSVRLAVCVFRILLKMGTHISAPRAPFSLEICFVPWSIIAPFCSMEHHRPVQDATALLVKVYEGCV